MTLKRRVEKLEKVSSGESRIYVASDKSGSWNVISSGMKVAENMSEVEFEKWKDTIGENDHLIIVRYASEKEYENV